MTIRALWGMSVCVLGLASPVTAAWAQGGYLEFGMDEFEATRAVGPLRNAVRTGSVIEGHVRRIDIGGISFDRMLRFENNRLVRISMTRFDTNITQRQCQDQMTKASDAVARRRTKAGTDRYGNIRYSYSVGERGSVAVQMGYVDVLRQTRELWKRERPDERFPHGDKGSCSMRVTYDYR